MAAAGTSPEGGWRSHYLLGCISVWALLLPYLIDKGYARFGLETASAFGVGVVLATPLAMLCTHARWARRLFPVTLLYALVDFYFIDSRLFAWILLAGAAALCILSLRPGVEENLRWAAGAFCVFFLLGGLLRPETPLLGDAPEVPVARQPASDLPAYIHLIMDEHGAHLPPTVGAAEPGPAGPMAADYVDRGFAVFPATRSVSESTQVALAEAFLLDGDAAGDAGNVRPGEGGITHRLKDNRLFDSLRDAGYRIEVIQSTYLDLCDSPDLHCRAYSRADHGREMARFGLRAADRLRLALLELHLDLTIRDSPRWMLAYAPIASLVRRHSGLPSKRNYWSRTPAMLALMDDLVAQLTEGNLRGRAWVVHVMLPHFPYMLDADCELRPFAEWSIPDWASGRLDPRGEADMLEAYRRQSACAQRRVLALVDAVDRNPTGANAVFVVHGDHGPRNRFPRTSMPSGELGVAARVTSLDVLFAIRAPWVDPGITTERATLERRLEAVLLDHMGSSARPREGGD